MAEETTDQTITQDVPAPESMDIEGELVSPKETGALDEEESDTPAESQPQDETLESSPELRLQASEQALEEAKAEAEKNRTDYLRALADMANLRKRTEREKDNARKFAIEKFASDLLNVTDNVQRAMDSLNGGVETGQADNSAVQSVIQGVQMIQSELENLFAKNGITRIESVNQPFDPNLHQAVLQVAAENVKPGTVVQEMRAGYLLNDRLLRPAMVSVSQ